MNQILEAREARSNHINQLMSEFEYKTIAILKLNVVGNDKNPELMRFICLLFDKLIKEEFGNKIIKTRKKESLDGDYIYYVIDEEGTVVKERTINIEDNQYLGRLVDIDVYNKTSISRYDMECEMRKCIICDNFAHMCSRNQTHTKEEINKVVMELIEEHLTQIIETEVMRSIYDELDMYPKFGLVTHLESGSHDDMDYETFIRSTFAIKPFISEFILYGLRDEDDIDKLKEIGLKCEQAMFKATNGINTQKGLIFALGLLLPALSKAILHNKDKTFVQKEIQRLAETIIGDYYETLNKKEELSNGDKVFLNHNIKGIRGEALQGFTLIFDIDSYEQIESNIRPYEYLINIMSLLEDTTIIHRKGLDTLRNVQSEMTELIRDGGFTENTIRYKELSDKYKKDNISPGGSSDLLVLKIIYENLKFLICTTCIT